MYILLYRLVFTEIPFTKVLDRALQLHTVAVHFRHVNIHSEGITLKPYEMCGLTTEGTKAMGKGGNWWR
jgi:hypothetical protein